jgi:hypothetical protein
MEFLTQLWLPILASAAAVFVVSSILHMVLPIHRGDYGKIPGEDAALDALRDVPPGQYMFPCPSSMKDMASPEMVAKYERGPVGTLVVVPSRVPPIGKSLLIWFGLSVVISIFTAYLAWHALPPGAEFMSVLRIAGTIGVLGYAFANMNDSIWKGVRWGVTAKFVFDGLVYGVATGLVFAAFWPAAT